MARARITWNSAQERRLREAVSKYNAAITRMEKSGNYDVLPNKTSVAREKNLIETRDELYQREKELGRILVKNKPDALDFVDMDGYIAPKYLADEIKYATRTINTRRKEQREQLLNRANSFRSEMYNEPLSSIEEITMLSNKNLVELHEDYYVDGDDLDDLWEEMYPKTYQYAEKYKEAWMEYNGNSFVLDVIDYMAENYPDELALIFESGDDEVEINYIYSVEKSSDKTPVIIRHNNIMRYWNEVYHTYQGTNHPGYEGQ